MGEAKLRSAGKLSASKCSTMIHRHVLEEINGLLACHECSCEVSHWSQIHKLILGLVPLGNNPRDQTQCYG